MIESYVSIEDRKFLKIAVNLARRNVGLTGKNPSVGCVITYEGIIIGRGNTQLEGRPHAEIMAIKQAIIIQINCLPYFFVKSNSS